MDFGELIPEPTCIVGDAPTSVNEGANLAVNSCECSRYNKTGETVTTDSIVDYQIRLRCALESLASTLIGEFSAVIGAARTRSSQAMAVVQ